MNKNACTGKVVLFPREFHILNQIEILTEEGITSSRLREYGMLSMGASVVEQLKMWNIPINNKIKRSSRGYSAVVQKKHVLQALGRSQFIPSFLLRDVINFKNISVGLWAEQNNFGFHRVGSVCFVSRFDAYQFLAKNSPAPLSPPLPQPATPAASPARTTDLDRLIAKLAAMEEVHLVWERQNRDLLERCECLLEKTHDYHNIQKEQNRCLLRSLEKVEANLSRVMESFEIPPLFRDT